MVNTRLTLREVRTTGSLDIQLAYVVVKYAVISYTVCEPTLPTEIIAVEFSWLTWCDSSCWNFQGNLAQIPLTFLTYIYSSRQAIVSGHRKL
jgi:hypothetical protein